MPKGLGDLVGKGTRVCEKQLVAFASETCCSFICVQVEMDEGVFAKFYIQ